MVKVYLIADEIHPVIYVNEDDTNFPAESAKISKNLLKRYKKTFIEWRAIQSQLREIYYEARDRRRNNRSTEG